MATAVLDLEDSLKEYLDAENVFSSMTEIEFSNLLEGIQKGNYEHVEEVFSDIRDLGMEVWMESITKACQVRELGAVKRFATYVAARLRTEEDASSKRARTPSAQRERSRSRSRSSVRRGASTGLELHTPLPKTIGGERLKSRSISRSKSRPSLAPLPAPDEAGMLDLGASLTKTNSPNSLGKQASQATLGSAGKLDVCDTLKETDTLVDTNLDEMMRMRLRRSCTLLVKVVHVPQRVEHLRKTNKTKVQILLASSSTSCHLQEWGKNAEDLIDRASKLQGHVVKLEDVRFDDFRNVPFIKPGKNFCISAPPTSIPQDIFNADAVFTSFSSFASLPPYSRCSIQGVVRSAGEPEGHQNDTGSQRYLTDVELVDAKGYLLRIGVWSSSPTVFEVNRRIRMYNVSVNAQYQRGEVSDYSGWLLGPSVPHEQQAREVFVLTWANSS